MQKKNILVTGADGQLGQCFKLLANDYSNYGFFFCNSSVLDITNAIAIEAVIKENKIDVLLNCAAYTAVDKAEEQREISLLVNATAVGVMAAICSNLKVQLIHLSTDYVFNGNGSTPYLPNDKTDPVNYYGFTKLKGEEAAMAANPSTLVIRTSWVYSPFGKNFVKTMLNLLNSKEQINVVADQFGSPTYAIDLAKALLEIIRTDIKLSGIYHYCNTGIISWCDFATAIKQGINSSCLVNPITTAEFPTSAKRPSYSALDTKSFEKDFNQNIPGWKESLMACLNELNK